LRGEIIERKYYFFNTKNNGGIIHGVGDIVQLRQFLKSTWIIISNFKRLQHQTFPRLLAFSE